MILVTGATGFVGTGLVKRIHKKYEVRAVFRGKVNFPKCIEPINIAQINSCTDWSDSLVGVQCVIHLAGLAHNRSDSLEQFRNINTRGTLKLAEDAYAAGVKRFIFISSIGVNGVSNNDSFKVNDFPNPTEDYAISKHEAEAGLKNIAKNTGMEVVIIRPPLVYGRGAPGNFGTLLKIAEKNLPLPLSSINNQRSFVAIDNLVDFIVTCIDHPGAANQTFLVSDDEDISTSNLLEKLILAAGKKPLLLPMPVSVLKFLASIVGKRAAVERFSSSLTVDIEHTKKTLNWTPPITLDEGIRRCFK